MTKPEQTDPESIKPTPNTIWLTPDIVQAIIDAEQIFEDIENELKEG
tara:strand:+ start:2983 stop:3123 length:141 start_codon:yes stop_codon:yes gene_type:complete